MRQLPFLLASYNGGFEGSLNDILGQLSILLICFVCLAIVIGSFVMGVRLLKTGFDRELPLIVFGGVLAVIFFIVIVCFWMGCFHRY